MKTSRLEHRTARTERTALRLISSSDDNHFDVQAFEFDRQLVARSLEGLTAEIDRAAIDIEMVAAEGVFEEQISLELLREARRLQSTAHELKQLRTNARQAKRYPTKQEAVLVSPRSKSETGMSSRVLSVKPDCLSGKPGRR
jgi:hypothetical protein